MRCLIDKRVRVRNPVCRIFKIGRVLDSYESHCARFRGSQNFTLRGICFYHKLNLHLERDRSTSRLEAMMPMNAISKRTTVLAAILLVGTLAIAVSARQAPPP